MILIALSFLIFFNVISFFREKYHQPANSDNQKEGFVINHGNHGTLYNPLPAKWKFKENDDLNRKETNFNDSDWTEISPDLLIDSPATKNFKGIGWFRIHFNVNQKHVDEIFALHLDYYGASEIFLDGKKIYKGGEVSSDSKEEVGEIPRSPVMFSVHDTLNHVLAIRYSNHQYQKYYSMFDQKMVGIAVTSIDSSTLNLPTFLSIDDGPFWFIVLFIFFLTLSFVHLLLYLFYRKMKENLYYCLFTLLFSSIIFSLYLLMDTTQPTIYLIVWHYYLFLLIAFLLSIVACLYSLFRPSLWKRMFLIQSCLSVICLVTAYSESTKGIYALFIFANLLFTCIEAVRTVIFAMRRKMTGSNIIGTGVLIFFLFIFAMIIEGVIVGTVNYGEEDLGYFYIISLLCIVSIPISMSVYLAYVFANTNKTLAVKLEEVGELSARSIAQEKEKQQILADQNFTLEKQVKERTAEIHEQKKVIEEKNKDIIDSINYAKRIQAAMLPDEDLFKNIFANAFVLYEPRDIVSGDFYYATEIEGKKLIIAADCTGHGVPGALMSMVGCNIINKLAHENGIVSPKLLIESLHIQLRQALKQDLSGSVNRDGMDVAAVLIEGNKITYAGANRPLIWFTLNNELMEIKPDKTPVGGSHITAIELKEHFLQTSEVKEFYLFSDGFADQFGGPEHKYGGKKLMVSRFKQWLKEICELQTDDQSKFLKSGFDQWRGNNEQVDDVMVIGIKP